MPKRLGERTFKTPEVQGDDSWMRVRSLTVGEVLDAQREREQHANFWHGLGRVAARALSFLLPGLRRKAPSARTPSSCGPGPARKSSAEGCCP